MSHSEEICLPTAPKPSGGLARRIGSLGTWALLGLLVLSGCSSINTQQKQSSAGYASHHTQKDKDKGILNLGSLFEPKEPEPPKTVKEWMKLPRSDP